MGQTCHFQVEYVVLAYVIPKHTSVHHLKRRKPSRTIIVALAIATFRSLLFPGHILFRTSLFGHDTSK